MNNDILPRSLSFLAGASAGLALGFYLHSEKGSALRQQLTERWGEALDALGERAQEQFSDLLHALTEALDKGLDLVEVLDNQLHQNVTDARDEVSDAIDDAETSFENGMDKARARLEQKFNEAGL